MDWIARNVASEVTKPPFIRALTTAISENAIEGVGSSRSLNIAVLKNYLNVLKKFVDGSDQLELQCLYALQALINKLEHPKGLLNQLFQSFYEENVVPTEAFYQWETSTDPHEQENKGVALKSLTSFFTWLREPDDEDSDS